MYLGLLNSTCCILMIAVGLLIIDYSSGFSDDHYIQVGNLIRLLKSIF